ncbi:MAG: type II toxin-antitoxin system Phd/YefM family antitoxin [Actinobacteria bacterium]|nr:MAG: type II toxin-antitoxin system Phd/YefM family antitoxin [Actinomycetota bacterium]
MPTITDMTKYFTITDAKAHLNEIVDALDGATEEVVITRNGKPVAVFMSMSDYQGLLETLDIMRTPGAVEEIKAAEDRIAAGDYITGEALRAKYLPKD